MSQRTMNCPDLLRSSGTTRSALALDRFWRPPTADRSCSIGHVEDDQKNVSGKKGQQKQRKHKNDVRKKRSEEVRLQRQKHTKTFYATEFACKFYLIATTTPKPDLVPIHHAIPLAFCSSAGFGEFLSTMIWKGPSLPTDACRPHLL